MDIIFYSNKNILTHMISYDTESNVAKMEHSASINFITKYKSSKFNKLKLKYIRLLSCISVYYVQ